MYKRQHNLKDGKPIENPNPKLEDKTDDMAAIIANAVSAAVKPLSDKLAQFETEKLQATRQEQIMACLLYTSTENLQSFPNGWKGALGV